MTKATPNGGNIGVILRTYEELVVVELKRTLPEMSEI
jgi:hypothetical protein